MTVLRAGIVGLGVMGRNHLRVLKDLDGVELTGVYDPSLSGTNNLPGLRVHTSLTSLLESNLDYCVVASPTAFHLDIGLQLAERGIHALIEKPLAADVASAEKLVTAFSTRGLIGGVGHIERFNPAIQAMRSKISDGLLGNVYQILTRRQGPYPARIADVGVVKDLATHDIDLAMWVTQSSYASISARTAMRSGRPHEDMVIAVGTMENGVIVGHIVNWMSPFKERTSTVIGDNGALVADTLTGDLTYYANGRLNSTWDQVSVFRGVSEGDITRFALRKVEPLLTEHISFRDAILARSTKGIVCLSDGVSAVRVAEQMLSQA